MVREEFGSTTDRLVCPQCAQQIHLPDSAVTDLRVARCLVCPSTDLYIRKDFPQRLGVSLVIVGLVASSIAWANYMIFWTFAILFATALVDVVLYVFVGNSLLCYRCGAQYRGVEEMESHGGFNLETHERYRQLAARSTTLVKHDTR